MDAAAPRAAILRGFPNDFFLAFPPAAALPAALPAVPAAEDWLLAHLVR